MNAYHILAEAEREQIAEILSRRANEIASFKIDLNAHIGREKSIHAFPGSVELALDREVERLRRLRDKLLPIPQGEEDEA